jgi:hypothetical protein
MKRELQELDAKAIPATMLTSVITKGTKSVYLWVENMQDSEMSFNCI